MTDQIVKIVNFDIAAIAKHWTRDAKKYRLYRAQAGMLIAREEGVYYSGNFKTAYRFPSMDVLEPGRMYDIMQNDGKGGLALVDAGEELSLNFAKVFAKPDAAEIHEKKELKIGEFEHVFWASIEQDGVKHFCLSKRTIDALFALNKGERVELEYGRGQYWLKPAKKDYEIASTPVAL